MTAYVLQLHDPLGVYIATLDVIASLDCAQPANDVGVLTLQLPVSLPATLLRRDSRLLLDRTVSGLTRTTTWLLRYAEQVLDERAAVSRRITAFDPRHLLRRRIVALASQGTKTGPADDLMKAIVRDNFVTATDPDRNLGDLLTVAADTSDAPTVTLEFANRNVLQVLQELAAASLNAGTYLAFDVVPVGTAFEFGTFTEVWGVDRRADVLLSAERGTLAVVSAVTDWTAESTAVYASGRGEGNAAPTATATDLARIGLSPFGRFETYLNASSATTVAAVQSAADAALAGARPREQFTARLIEQSGMRYGIDLFLGDLIRAEHDGTLYDCRVEPVHLTIDEAGNETVDIQLRNSA